MHSGRMRGGGGFERTGRSWLVASMTAVLVWALVGATAASMGQLTERPLAGALAHPAIGYYTRPSYDPDDRTLFRQRWGGWYVTGTHGSMRHMGNAIVTNIEKREAMISDSTLNRTSLDGVFDARGYVSAHSDIAALMVFQHQGRMTNLITRIGWDARLAAYDDRVDLAGGPLRDAVNELVDYLLFA